MRHTAERHQNAIREGNQSAISATQGGRHLEDRFGRPANGHRASPHKRTALAFGEPAQRGKGIGGGCQVDREHLHLMSEAIRGQQWSSEVISGHQWSSEVIRVHQRSSEVISGHQWSSEVIRPGASATAAGGVGGIQRPSEELEGHPRPLEAFRGHRRPSEEL